MKKLNVILLTTSLFLGILIFSAITGSAQSVTVGTGTLESAPESEVKIPIMVKGAPGISAMEIVLTYDNKILEVKNVDKGTLLTGNSLLEFNSDQAGRLGITIVTLDQVKGDGDLLKASFMVRGEEGQKSPLLLENVRAWEGENRLEVLVTKEAGEFTVSRAGLPLWLIALIVLILAVVFLVILRKKKSSPK